MDTLPEGRSSSGYAEKWAPRSTSRRDDRLVVNQVLRNRLLKSTDLQQYLRCALGVTVSRQTIRNCVPVGGLRARRAQERLPFKARHRRARLSWCTASTVEYQSVVARYVQ